MGEYKYDCERQGWSRVTTGYFKSSQTHRASPEGWGDKSLQSFCYRHRATKGINSEMDVNVAINVHQSSDHNAGFTEHYI